jgi:hypothetical protein
MMSENIAQNMYSSQGIINYSSQLHLVGHFRILYYDARKHEYQGKKSFIHGGDPGCFSSLSGHHTV